jgi:hypothetical protein
MSGDDAAAASARDRYRGSAEDFAMLIEPAVRSANFLVYDGAKKVTQTKCQPSQIEKHHQLLSLLHQGAPNLCFVRSVVHDGLKILHGRHGGWNLKVYTDTPMSLHSKLEFENGWAWGHSGHPQIQGHTFLQEARVAVSPVPFRTEYGFSRTSNWVCGQQFWGRIHP